MTIQSLARKAAVLGVLAGLLAAGPVAAATIRIVALGDSLTAGFGLPEEDSLPAKLEAALKAKGHDVAVVNAGVSGDTASDGLARLDWSVGEDADAVILELGANDALRGLDPKVTRAALEKVLARLAERRLPVLLAGMLAPRNYGEAYAAEFDAIYPELAKQFDVLLYPFIFEGVVLRPELIQADGLHPTAAGIDTIVAGLLPKVEELLARAAAD